jgi:PAS domain-containing protein
MVSRGAARDGTGRKVILEYRNRLIRDANGEPRAVQGAARDVTQRIAYEKALKKSEEKNKAIVQHAPAGIFEVDLTHGRFVSANEVMSGYTGYALDELMQMDPFSLFSPESAERARKLFERTIPGDGNLPPA